HRQRGHALGVDAPLAGKAEELVKEVLDASPRSEGEAHASTATVRGPGVRGTRRYRHGLPRTAHGLLTAASQQDVAIENLELLFLRPMNVFCRQERRRTQFEVQLGERTAGLLACANERDPLPGDRVLDDVPGVDHT